MDVIDFRPATGKDVNELFNLLNSLSDEVKKFFHPHPFDKRTLEQILTSKKDHYFVLTVNKKIIGYSMLRFYVYKIPSFGVCIRKDYENHGYGNLMTEKTMKKAIEIGYKEVILNVHEENSRAIDLYERIGFKAVQKNPDTREIKMKKSLAPNSFFF